MFIDEAEIYVEGGRGGDGCVSFLREKYRPHGGPDGGSGGAGGSVTLEAATGRSTLVEFHRRRHHRAKPGVRGGSQKKSGARGADLAIQVPVGTVVKAADGAVLADLVEAGDTFIVARGGRGGRGNAVMVNEAGPLPRFAEKGEPGDSRTVQLELKLVADVAIVGFPNAGKSSLISRISRAKPKIADYPFTTTEPNLGVVMGDDFDYVVTDVPGLVEGAHTGKGMGIAFLRHIERAAVIVYLVDISPMSGREPVQDLELLEDELGAFNPRLLSRERLVAANKVDLDPPLEKVEDLRRVCRDKGLELFLISMVTGEGVPDLLRELGRLVSEARAEGVHTGPVIVFSTGSDEDLMTVRHEDDRLVVEGKRVERMVSMTDWNNEEAMAHLARKLCSAGVDDFLAREGARAGDEVEIAGRVFEYFPETDEVVREQVIDRKDAGRGAASSPGTESTGSVEDRTDKE